MHRLPALLSRRPVPRPPLRPSSPLPASYPTNLPKSSHSHPRYISVLIGLDLFVVSDPACHCCGALSSAPLATPRPLPGFLAPQAPCAPAPIPAPPPPFCLLQHCSSAPGAQCRFSTAACLRCSPFSLAETRIPTSFLGDPNRLELRAHQGPSGLQDQSPLCSGSQEPFSEFLLLRAHTSSVLPNFSSSVCFQEALFICVCVSGLPASSPTLGF